MEQTTPTLSWRDKLDIVGAWRDEDQLSKKESDLQSHHKAYLDQEISEFCRIHGLKALNVTLSIGRAMRSSKEAAFKLTTKASLKQKVTKFMRRILK